MEQRYIRCKRCGVLGFVWHRDASTYQRWELFTGIKQSDGSIKPDLGGGPHKYVCKGQRDQQRQTESQDVPQERQRLDKYVEEQIQKSDGGQTERTQDRDFNGEGDENVEGDSLADAIAKAVKDRIKQSTDEKRVREIAREEAQSAIEKLGDSGKVVTIVLKPRDGVGEVKMIDGAHRQTPELLFWVEANVPVMLYGKPGASKSHTCHQVANALGLTFGYISLNPQTPESRLFGFKDANGTYRSTAFHDCYVNGGLFMIDEMDNASGALLTSMNASLSNKHCAFPDGLMEMHRDFRIVATANTPGRGGDRMHQERRPLDSATLDRFIAIHWQYDEALEAKLAAAKDEKNGTAWAQWIQRVRAYVEKNAIALVVSPRASMYGATALKSSAFTVREIAEMVLFKGLDRDTVGKILNACPLPTFETKS